MSLSVKFRLTVLSIMLLVVIAIMANLDSLKVDGFFKSVGMDLEKTKALPPAGAVVGATTGGAGGAAGDVAKSGEALWKPYKISLCQNRVHAVIWPNAGAAAEKGAGSGAANGDSNPTSAGGSRPNETMKQNEVAKTVGRKIEEYKSGMKMRWQAFDALDASGGSPLVREINYIQVEKWLSTVCAIPAERAESPQALGLVTWPETRPFLTVEFIDASKMEFSILPASKDSTERLFRQGDVVFRSSAFAAKVKELGAQAAWDAGTLGL